jgi:hypothetical protein
VGSSGSGPRESSHRHEASASSVTRGTTSQMDVAGGRHRTASATLYQEVETRSEESRRLRRRTGSEVESRDTGSMRSGRSSRRHGGGSREVVDAPVVKKEVDVPLKREMSVETLAGFLEKVKLRNYVGLFEEAFIDLETMLTLDDEDLKELGIKLSSHRQTLITACATYSKPVGKVETKGDQFGWSGSKSSPAATSPISPSSRKDREEFGNIEQRHRAR